MKSILKSLFLIIVTVVVVSGATYAAWTAQAKVEGNTFSTGNAALQVRHAGTAWGQTIPGPIFNNLYPDWTQDYSVKVHNKGTVNLMLSLKGEVGSGWSDPKNLRGKISVEVREFTDLNNNWHFDSGEGTKNLGIKTLQAWLSESLVGSQVDAGEQQCYLLRFSVGDLADSFQGATLSGYNFVFDGTTAGTTQPSPSPLP